MTEQPRSVIALLIVIAVSLVSLVGIEAYSVFGQDNDAPEVQAVRVTNPQTPQAPTVTVDLTPLLDSSAESVSWLRVIEAHLFNIERGVSDIAGDSARLGINVTRICRLTVTLAEGSGGCFG